MPSPSADAMDTSSQYSSCETLDSHRSSEFDEKNEVNGNDGQRTNRRISVEHSDYIQKERVTRAAPPKPAYNPMQFVAIKPSNLFQSAQEQLKKAEEVRKAKEVNRKEEPEDWQNNLDNWKSSRRKRVEHIIDRVVEVKKLEEEEHDRNRRKSKTFNELMEDRGSRRKLSTLPIYAEEDSSIDMTGLTPSETTDAVESSDKPITNSDNRAADDVDKRQPNDVQRGVTAADDAINNNSTKFHSTALIKDVVHKKPVHREVQEMSEVKVGVTSSTYSMSVKTKTVRSSFETRERDYTYDDAIEDYKTRVSKASKLDLPKVDIHKRRELFEKEQQEDVRNMSTSTAAAKLGTEIGSIKDRISSLRHNLATTAVTAAPPKKVELPTSTKLKDRLSSLHQLASPVDEPKRNPLDAQFRNVQEAKHEFEMKQQTAEHQNHNGAKLSANDDNESLESSTDREDSGIQTTDVSCAVSQADEQTEQQIDEFQQVIQEKITKLNVSETAAAPAVQPDDVKDEADMETIDDESSVIEEALDMAFQIIDNETVDPMPIGQESDRAGDFNVNMQPMEPIYENVDDGERDVKPEPHYSVPRSREPYYESPKKAVPIPLYENVELMFPTSSDSSRFSMAESNESFGVDDGTEMVFPIDQSKYLIMEPPKEKPPPLPAQEQVENNGEQIDNFKRINSTKRIKKEIRNKRSSFLGIEGQELDDYSLELSIAPPPDMQALLQEEKRLEKQLYQKVGLYENSDNGESRDSGLSDNHSRQSSEPSSTSSELEQTMGEMSSAMLMSEQRGNFTSYTVNEDDTRIKTLEEQISKQEKYSNYQYHHGSFDDDHQEVLRVEQLLLQIEQQELKRQRENLVMRKNLARRELDEGVKLLMTNNPSSLSLQDLNESNVVNVTNGSAHYDVNNHHRHVHPNPNHQQTSFYQMNDYRKSMPNLQDFGWHQNAINLQQAPSSASSYQYPGDLTTSSKSEMHLNQSNLVPKPYQPPATHHHHNNNVYSNMTRHALMQISAVPKPKLTNDWVQFRKSEPVKPSINSHWLIQEAEQRRIEQLNNVRSKKPLPESVIQTLTQRVQNMGLGVNVNKRYTIFDSKQMPPIAQTPSHAPLLMVQPPQTTAMHNQMAAPPVPVLPSMDVLSVSSKKLCSYCNHELGSGAAMIIENLGLFYHIDCFKCSVCQTPISDGNIHGTDVRVRNSRLHCHNCFSNEDGIKFSCV